MKPFLFFTLFLISLTLFAQEKPISDSARSIAISESRRYLMEEFLRNDMNTVGEAMQYLCRELETKEYLALYPEEKWMIWLYLQQYDSLFSAVRDYDKREINKIEPEPDELYTQLLGKTSACREAILKQIDRKDVPDASNLDFLPLLLDYCCLGTDYETLDQEKLNNAATKYMATYPLSAFNPFIKKYVQFILTQKDWTFGADIATGMNIIDGRMHNTFSHQGGFGFGFDLAYKKITGFFRLNIDFGRTRDTIHFSNFTWNKHKLANNLMGELSFGYPLKLSPKIKLLPFAGIGMTSLYPRNPNKTDENPDAANPYHINAFCWVGGLTLDYKLGKSSPLQLVGSSYQKNTGYLRIRYSIYQTEFSPSRKAYNGYIHNISVGLQGFIEWFQ
jgi:hypothetical protein